VNRSELEASVREVAAAVLGRPIAPGEAVTRTSEPGWDSLRHVELLFAVEAAVSVRFDADELASLDGVDAIVAACARHVEASACVTS
jgi:acyl carrier protein